MKFTVAKREVDVRLEHIILVAVLFCTLAIGMILISLAAVLAIIGGASSDEAIRTSAAIVWYFSIISAPIVSSLLLWGGGVAKMKTDAGFCRSVAAASYMITASLYVIFFALYLIMLMFGKLVSSGMDYDGGFGGMYPAFGIPTIASEMLILGAGAIVSYFWLMIVMEPKAERVKKAAASALLFALCIFAFDRAAAFAMDYSAGIVTPLMLDYTTGLDILRDFMFAFAILYHMIGKKLDMDAARLFAGLYLGGTALLFVDNVLIGPYGVEIYLIDIARSIVTLTLIYTLSRTKDISL